MQMTAIRSLVRPVVTAVVVGAYVAAAFLSDTPVDELKDITLIVVAFYFGTRSTRAD